MARSTAVLITGSAGIGKTALGEWFEPAPGFRARLWNAGHILGAASVELEADGQRLMCSGDIGPDNKAFEPDPAGPAGFDHVICEATYGDRQRERATIAERRTLLEAEVRGALVRGGNLDFEGIACDAAGNRYLVSEAHAAVLQLPVSGAPNWLRLPPGLLSQARASGMLMNFNALFEGIAVDPEGKRLWLAAERERRGDLLRSGRRAGRLQLFAFALELDEHCVAQVNCDSVPSPALLT